MRIVRREKVLQSEYGSQYLSIKCMRISIGNKFISGAIFPYTIEKDYEVRSENYSCR